MIYQQDIGLETLTKEYKVFSFNNINLTDDECMSLLKSAKWVFNEITDSTLKHYLTTFVPKYMAAYSNPKSQCDGGTLYFGIDDDGIVHGIPYNGEITIEFIKMEINKIFGTNIRGINNIQCINNYADKMVIEIIKLDKSEYLCKYSELKLTNSFIENNEIYYNNIQYIKIISKMETDIKNYKTYINKKRKWNKIMTFYTMSLHEIIHNDYIRKEIIDYIRMQHFANKKAIHEKYKNIYGYCDFNKDYWNLINELKTPKKYHKINAEDADKFKSDQTNLFYWIMKWRDAKISTIRLFKPKICRVKLNHKMYSLFILSQVPKMIPSWIINNPELNLFVIKINLAGNINPNIYLEYADNVTKEWIQSYRMDYNGMGEPCCIPIIN